jgi:hypothetical protein
MTGRRGSRLGFQSPRELLLVEVRRRCRGCDGPARLGLTRAEARAYQGFECGHCESWNDDELTEQDIPEWWEEQRRGLGGAAGESGGGGPGGEGS